MATETVTRSKRKECWESRDTFYACLDSNGGDESKCIDLQTKYETACPKAWVTHFNMGRRKQIYVDRLAQQEAAQGRPLG